MHATRSPATYYLPPIACLLLLPCLAGGAQAAGTLEVGTLKVGVIAPLQPREEGLELYLPFGTDGGGTAPDASGNGRDGAVTQCAWTDGGRYAGGAMRFTGTYSASPGSAVALATAPDFPAWPAYTVSAWFRHDGGGYLGGYQYGHKIADKTSVMHDWHLRLIPHADPPGAINWFVYEGGAARNLTDQTHNYMDNQWHHVVAVRDGANAQFWVDGELKDSISDMIPVYSTSAFCVGNSLSGDSYQRTSFSGLIDEVRVYGRALPPAEIALLHTQGAPLPPPPVTMAGDLAIGGSLTVTGAVIFAGGALHLQPSGDLSSGIYTNSP
jgi:hypothetical protein